MLWSEIRPLFREFNSTNVTPNNVQFICDDRFILSVSLDKLSFQDFSQKKSDETRDHVLDHFFFNVINSLDIHTLTRVGTRIISYLPCKNKDQARATLRGVHILPIPTGRVFDLELTNYAPTYTLENDDGELGYRILIQSQTRQIEVSVSPDAVDLLAKQKRTEEVVAVDVDFFTLKPVEARTIKPSAWVQRWERTLSRDVDRFFMLRPVDS